MEQNNQFEYKAYIDDIGYELEKSYRSKNRLRIILKLYSAVAILSSVVAGLYFIISFYELSLSTDQRISIIVAGTGILLSLATKIYSDLIAEKEKEQEERKKQLNKISNFILNWTTLERTVYSVLERHENNISKFGIKRNIRLLYDEDIISDRELIILERALDLRNRVVHGQITSTNEDLERYSEQINEVIDKILIWSKRQH